MMRNKFISKYSFTFFAVFIFMMANDALFTWVGMICHLSYWRQLMSGISFLVFIKIINTNSKELIQETKIINKYKKFFIYIFVLSIITFILYHFNVIRLVYSWWFYFFGLPFILLPFIVRRYYGWEAKKLNLFFILLGLFLSIGIFCDFLSGGLITSMFLLVVKQEDGDFGAGRYCFLSTAPTIFSIYYCLCLFCCMVELYKEKTITRKYVFFIISLFFIFGSLFCGSRQTLAALLIVFAGGLLTFIKDNVKTLFVLLAVLATSTFFMPIIQTYIGMNGAIERRYNTDAIQEDDRTETWMLGVKESILDFNIKRMVIGEGIGFTLPQKAQSGEAAGDHYENTFFARVSDMGWYLALSTLLLPVVSIFRIRKKLRNLKIMYLSMCIAYIFICCVSPNGASNTTQMAMFILLGMAINEVKDYEKKI